MTLISKTPKKETAEETLKRKIEIETSVRELFAKLLATENISVLHTSVPTPCFNLKTRTLELPVWKDISKELYVMMIAHEVAHALHTPMDRWEDAVKNCGFSNTKVFKDVVNVIEDARIEKLVQIRYPGTKRAFLKGYEELLRKFDLFKFDQESLSSRSLIDRINLYFKVTKYGGPSVPFSEKEKVWIVKVETCRSFEDVVSLSKELYEDLLENSSKEEVQESDSSEGSSDSEGKERNKDTKNGNKDSDSDKEGNFQRNSQEEDNKEESPENNDENKDPENSSNEENRQESKQGKSNKGFNDKVDPKETPTIQDILDSAKNELADKNNDLYNNTIPTYVNLPVSNDNNKVTRIVDYKTVHDQIKKYYSGVPSPKNAWGYHYYNGVSSPHGKEKLDAAYELFSSFKNKHRPTVSSMVNLFEMKKRAALYSRVQTSKTGLLNLNKIHSYKYNDDIFKKMTVTPEGKNHGMVMFIDLSGSMDKNIAGTFEQTLILCMFCKKVGIPFDVYGFSNATYVDFGYNVETIPDNSYVPESNFSLRHYLSSKMNLKEFNEASSNVFALALAHNEGKKDIPSTERLCQTPLNACIAYSYDIIRNFKSKNGLDIVNAIYLTDGDATDNVYVKRKKKEYNSYSYGGYNSNSIGAAANIVFRNPLTGMTWNSSTRDQFHRNHNPHGIRNVMTTPTLLEIVGSLEGVNVIGFFVTPDKSGVPYSQREKFSKDGFVKLENFIGYKNYYFVKGGKNLSVEDTSIEFEKGASLRKIRSAYLKSREKSITNKVLLNKFIENISVY